MRGFLQIYDWGIEGKGNFSLHGSRSCQRFLREWKLPMLVNPRPTISSRKFSERPKSMDSDIKT